MKSASILSRTVKRFNRDESGNYALMLAATIPMLMIGVGFGINTVQMGGAQQRLASALDAALVSTARDISSGKIKPADAEATALMFLEANSNGGFLVPGTVGFSTFSVDKTTGTISASVTGKTKLAFPVFSGDPDRVIGASAGTLYSDSKVEVAMMLDVTGSMGGQKLKDLKSAAKNAVSTFLAGQAAGSDRVRLSIVPYADAVNTGSLNNLVHYETAFTTGEPPALTDPVLVGYHPDNCATERKGTNQFTDASPNAGKINRDVRLSFCPSAKLLPLTADKAKLDATIDSFVANGFTAGHIGVQWSWYMLSPKWKSVLPAAAKPGNYNDKKVKKYAILMTDGEFNTAFAGVANGAATQGGQPVKSRNNAEDLCKEMRKKGIEVFTIGFQLNSASPKGVMKNCASADSGKTKHYFETSSGTELDAAFQEIARTIERLTVTN